MIKTKPNIIIKFEIRILNNAVGPYLGGGAVVAVKSNNFEISKHFYKIQAMR